jgi:hypothetical protein
MTSGHTKPYSLIFNNCHYNRISSSSINVYDTTQAEVDMFSNLPYTIIYYAEFDEKENYGNINFLIHNERQMELNYADKLYEYFQ